MDHAEVAVSPIFRDGEEVQANFREAKDATATVSPSAPATAAPKVVESIVRIKLNIPAGLYDLYW